MDQKLVLCITSLKEEAEAARAGAPASDLNSLVADASDLCKQMLSDEDISFAIAVIFDRDSGIFSVVELLLPVKDRAVVKAKESCCTFLAEFIEQIGERSLSQSAFLKEKCLHIFRRDESKVVQAAALSPLLSILEIAGTQQSSKFHVDWGFAEVLLHEYSKAKSSGTLRSNILMLLGYSVEYYPTVFREENVKTLLKMCLDTLEEQLRHSTKDPLFVLVSGLLKCLDSLLTWYDDSVPAGGSIENSRKLYMYMIQVICYRDDLKRYEVVKAGLRLLSRHAALFKVRLVQDSKDILSWLQIYCTHANAQLRDAGFAAFNDFIHHVSQCLIDGDSRVQNAQDVYRHLMSTFLKILDARELDSKLLSAFAVKGIGQLSPAILKFSGKDTLQQVSHKLIPFGGKSTKSGEDKDYLLGHSDTLIGAFADIIMHLETVEDYVVSFIAEVTGNIFYQFPQLFPKQKKGIYVTLTMLFKSLYLKGTIFSIFLTNIVWSSLERTMESSEVFRGTGLPIWPHYVELWLSLLEQSTRATGQRAPPHEGGNTYTETISAQDGDEQRVDLNLFQEFIFDTLIRCIMKTLGELNLKYRVREIDKQLPASSTLLQDDMDAGGVEPETEMDMIEPLNIDHMHKYLDLVEFIQGLLTRHVAHLFLKWVYPFSCCIMELSNHYPLISGNYKLLTTAMKIADEQGFFSSNERSLSSEIDNGATTAEEDWKFFFVDNAATGKAPPALTFAQQEPTKRLFRQFLREVLVASRRYKFELLASCLRFCLSAPPALMDLSLLVAPLQTALRMGLRYSPLASVAMGTLESWRQLYPHELDPWLPQIVIFLSDYLTEIKGSEVSESVEDDDQGSGLGAPTPASLSRTQLARMRRTRAKANQPGEFETIQLRVQKFLGQIGHYNHHLISKLDLLQVSSTGGLAWDPVDRIQFTIPFRDVKYDIWLDSLLPRVVELALSSSDRRTKVAASELLQALCVLMLGNSAKGPMRRTNDKSHSIYLDKIYKRLFPAIFRLAVDVELVSRQLFNEFAKQLIHWYTSNQQRENPETVALLDAILDGLVDADNGSLREYCAVCFGEFMSWSVRHAPPEANDFVNVKSILQRLYNRMDHPNPYKRLGASMAAYRIYPVLRATPSIVDRYILELISFCIKSLRIAEADDKQIGTEKQLSKTLDCYLKLVQRNIGGLQRYRKDRAAFLKLEDFLDWLLTQTAQLQEKCRSMCMSALSIICRSLPIGSVAEWFRSRFNDEVTTRNSVKDVDFEMDPKPLQMTSGTVGQAQQQLRSFIRSLHWFTWALKVNMITTEELQINTRSGVVVEIFLQQICTDSGPYSTFNAVTPAEREAHQKLKCSSIIQLLGFIKQILEVEFGVEQKGIFLPRDINRTSVNQELLEKLIPISQPKFLELICLALLRPRDLGFVITDTGVAEELVVLAAAVMQMLAGFSELFKERFMGRLQALFHERRLQFDPGFVNLSLGDSEKQETISLEDAACLVSGYQQLHLSGSLLPALGTECSKRLGEMLLMKVFEIERECPPALESIASEMLNLSIALGTRVQKLVECCLDDKPIMSSSNTRRVTAGAIFYMNFRKVIVRRVKFSFRQCSRLLLDAAARNPTSRLLMSAILDDFITSNEQSDKLSKGSFLKEMLIHIKLLQPCCTSNPAEKLFLLEILHKLFILDVNGDLLQLHQSALLFIEDTYLAFVNRVRSYEDTRAAGSSVEDSDFSVQSQSLALLPFFLKAPFEQDFQSRLAKAISRVVSDHLLVQESELLASSNQRSSYLQMLNQVLEALSSSGSVMLLENMFPLIQRVPKFAVNLVSDRLEQFAENIGEKRKDGFDLCLRIMMDESKVSKLRRAVVEKAFAPLIKAAPMDFVAGWYSPRIKQFVEVLQKEASGADADKEEESLIVKICHYFLMEQLFLKLDAKTIREKITPLIPNAVLIKQTVNESRAKFDPATPFPENSVLWRDLHISAYKCLAAVVMRTQEQEKVYSVLFKEGGSGVIWPHLVDTEKVYDNMPVETSQLSVTSQTLRGMRAKQKARIGPRRNIIGGFSTLSSQYFASVGLSQEPALINSFVSQDIGLRAEDGAESPGLNLTKNVSNGDTIEGDSSDTKSVSSDPIVEEPGLDRDDFDLHPCMTVVLNLIETLNAKFGVGQREMPEWMKGLHSTMQSSVTHVNIRLFLAKVVVKAWKVFASHCQHWFVPMSQTILLNPASSGGRTFHYMLRDICITILHWRFAKPPDAGVASDLVNHLISVAVHGSSQVLRANVDVIRLLVGNWKDDLQVDKRIILAYLGAGGKSASNSDRMVRTQRIVGLQLLGVMVASGFPIYDPHSDNFSEKELYDALLQNLNFKSKEVFEASGELLGMALKQRNDIASDLSVPLEEQLLEKPLRQALLMFIRESNLDSLLNVMNKITLRFPQYIDGFASLLIDLLPKLHGVFKVIALDIFLRSPRCVLNDLGLLIPSLTSLMTHRDEAAQFRTLQLLLEMIKESEDSRIHEKLVPVLCETFAAHENMDCRKLYYEVLIHLYERDGLKTDNLIVRSLLVGLADSADDVRRNLENFWHLNLSQDLGRRLTEMLSKMYDPVVEESWTQFACALLIKLCHDSVDFKRPVFNAPLSDCEFHDQTINTSWLGSSLPMTPLFSLSQSQNASQSLQGSQSQASQLTQLDNSGAPREAGFIRATMMPTLTQTQDTFASTLASQSQESALFAMSRRATGTQRTAAGQDSMTLEDSMPRRRILASSAARSQVVRAVMNANRRRDARASQQAEERGNKVQMMRRYRTGELPDIEINYEEILIPLAALAERDSSFARLLLTLICRAVYAGPSSSPSDQDKTQDVKSSMKSGIELALKKTRNGISFVGCVEALCLEDSDIWVQPRLVGSASLKSTNFHSGILLLENEILHLDSNESAYADTSSKRHKGASGAATQKASSSEEAWLELARLYHELGENDVVLSVYRKNLTKHAITHKALEAQLAGDSNQGLILYDQALDAMDDASEKISQIEQDIWYNQRLTCLVELNRWQQIVADTIFQVQDDDESSHPDLQRLWAPSVREPYLGLFIRGSVKVPTYRSMATDFILSSMEDPGKREVLMTQYGLHVAQLAVLNEQFDLARFHLLHCYRTFRQQWSALHPLAIGARYHQVQKLQKLVELDEYVELMTSQNVKGIPRKLWEWRRRWPSPREDSVEAWDDIVQDRLVFFDKFQGLVNKLSDPQSNNVRTGFATKLSEERAYMYSQAARGLTKQGAYNVAQRYMEDYISAHAKRDKLDYVSIKGLVKLRCLEASRIQSVQPNESIRMLQQVRSYIDTQKPAVDSNSLAQISFVLLEANVSFQLAFCKLSTLHTVRPDANAVNECISLLGAVCGAYSEIFTFPVVAENSPSQSQILQQLAKASLKFAQFFDELLKLTKKAELSHDVRTAFIRGDPSVRLPPASSYAALIVKHMMKAIKLDTSIRARQGVARLLSILSEYPETHEDFLDSVTQVPSWIFIPWIPQMLAAMDQADGELFVGILEDIAKSNPQALYFAYHVSEKDFGSTGKRRTKTLAQLLKSVQLQGFVRALEDLTFPEQRLRDGFAQIKNCLKSLDKKKARSLFIAIAEDCLDVRAMSETTRQAGEYNCKFARHWSKLVRNVLGEDGAALLHMDENAFTKSIRELMKPLHKPLQTGVISLGNLSQWMARFDGSGSRAVAVPPSDVSSNAHNGAIEIPGQYNSFNEPGSLPHVELIGFDQTLISLSSKQRPKVLTMRGSDENEYKFVVKGGEDIRLDQRIEQLFEVMNTVLRRDAAAARRGLSMRTYAVIPVSKSCGLLQFVENTVVLEDVVKAGLVCKLPQLAREGKDAASTFLMRLRAQHQTWVAQRAGPSSKHPTESFLALFRKVGREEMTTKLNTFQSQLPWDTFKAGVSRWATSAESYLALRSQFARSLSVVSICGYIAGVGDRHLGNTLVDIRSGSLVPIDFGYSFGTGVILLPVPELIPFRLTKQLTNFLLPLDALGLLRTDMIHTLAALHASRDVISAVMDVFVKEPLVDWKNEAMRISSSRERKTVPGEMESKEGQLEPNFEREFVELKVENAQRKLQLWNPATITVSELQRSVHVNTPYLSAIEATVLGKDSDKATACVKGDTCHSVSEQVDCLIDQATDPNLLGRLWSGWQAWV